VEVVGRMVQCSKFVIGGLFFVVGIVSFVCTTDGKFSVLVSVWWCLCFQ
jgi:hypothetical protein